MAGIVSDSFNRANSNTVGSEDFGKSWSEFVGGATADAEAIESNTLRLGNSSGNLSAGVRINCGSLTFPIYMQGKFNVVLDDNTRTAYVMVYYAADSTTVGDGMGFAYTKGTTNNITIKDGTTTRATGSFTISVGTDYYFWMDIQTNGSNKDVQLYLNTSNSKPGSPTLSATNQSFANNGNYAKLSVDSTNAGEWSYDDIVIRDSTAVSSTTSDTMTVGDSIVASMIRSFTASDTMKVGDVVNAARQLLATVSDTIKVGDVLSLVKSLWTRFQKTVGSWTNTSKF